MAKNNKKKKAAASTSTAVVPYEGEEPVAADDIDFEDDQRAHPADGGCVAEALVKVGVFRSDKAAALALDNTTHDWRTNPNSSLRDDQKCEEFLGKAGETWHIQAIQRTVLAQQYNFRKVAQRVQHIIPCQSHTLSPTRFASFIMCLFCRR